MNSDGTLNMVDTHPYFGGIQPEDADNVEKYPIECIQCFPSFDLGGNGGADFHQNANPTGKSLLPWPPVGASISNVSPIACIRGSNPYLASTFARTFRIAANVQKDYNTKVSGTNTGSTKLSKYECEKFASKYTIPFRVLWDVDSTSGGCWPYCIDLATMPIGCIYDASQDEVRYIEVDIPGFEGSDCSSAQRCITKPKYNGHYMDYKKVPGAHDFHHKWRFRKQYERKYREIAHSNNKDYPAGHWAEYGDRKIKFSERYGKSNRKIEQGRTCREASQALYGHQFIHMAVKHPTASQCWDVVPIPETTAFANFDPGPSGTVSHADPSRAQCEQFAADIGKTYEEFDDAYNYAAGCSYLAGSDKIRYNTAGWSSGSNCGKVVTVDGIEQNSYCVCRMSPLGTRMNNGDYARFKDIPKGCVSRHSATSGAVVLYTEDDTGNTGGTTATVPCDGTNKCIGWTLYGDSIEPGEDYIGELEYGGDYAPHGPIIEYSQKGGRKHYVANDCIVYEEDKYNFLSKYYQSYQSTAFTHPGKSDGDYYCYLESIYPGKSFQPGDAACTDAVENPNREGKIVSYDACKFYVQDKVDTRTVEESQLLADAYQKKVQYDNRNGLQRTCSLADLVMRDISWAYLDGAINPLEWEQKFAEAADNVEKCETNAITKQKENCVAVTGTYYQHIYSKEIRLVQDEETHPGTIPNKYAVVNGYETMNERKNTACPPSGGVSDPTSSKYQKYWGYFRDQFPDWVIISEQDAGYGERRGYTGACATNEGMYTQDTSSLAAINSVFAGSSLEMINLFAAEGTTLAEKYFYSYDICQQYAEVRKAMSANAQTLITESVGSTACQPRCKEGFFLVDGVTSEIYDPDTRIVSSVPNTFLCDYETYYSEEFKWFVEPSCRVVKTCNPIADCFGGGCSLDQYTEDADGNRKYWCYLKGVDPFQSTVCEDIEKDTLQCKDCFSLQYPTGAKHDWFKSYDICTTQIEGLLAQQEALATCNPIDRLYVFM